jgi:hypothetical protein
MKYNKWTIALAAVGVVSIGSVARAAESSALASVSSTVLSGYVDTSADWNLGTGDTHAPAYKYGGAPKADGFNLDVVQITLEKPLDESEWAAGYRVDLDLGPDANVLNTISTGVNTTDFAIKQAYVNLQAPVGNGLRFKVGVFDSVIGYESTEAINNPNFTRSWGHSFEPSTHTGVLATYQADKLVSFSAGIADTLGPRINARTASGPAALGNPNESSKTYMGSVALTAPDDWGFVAGSTLYAGTVQGFNVNAFGSGVGLPQQSYYAGATLNTPVSGLKVGAAWDYARTGKSLVAAGPGIGTFGAHSFAAYASYQATEKLSLHARAEYADVSASAADAAQAANLGIASTVLSGTATAQYDLWKNVLSRVEFRWDHALDGTDAFGGTRTGGGILQSGHFVTGTLANSFELLANVIYKF